MNIEKQNELVRRAQAGDSEAMDALFTEYYNNVYYFALKTVKDEELACDITQETFMEIIQTIGDLKEPAAFMTWMKQITYHQCTRYFKKKKDVLLDESKDEDGNTIFDTLADDGPIPQEILEKEEFRQTILGIINELSEEQRSAVLMYYFDEMSVSQIAQVQGVSEGTVKSRLNYARKAIKKSVEGYEQKTGIKLHSFAILPVLALYFGQALMPTAQAAKVHAAVMGSMGAATAATATTAAATTAAANTAAAVTTAATTTTSAAATTAATTAAVATGGSLAVKIGAGVLAAALAAGGLGVATGVIPTPWTEPEETVEQSVWEDEEETTAPEETYENDVLTALGDSRNYQDVFDSYLGSRITYFRNKNGELVKRNAPTEPLTFGAGENHFLVGQYPAYQDNSGVSHILMGDRDVTLTGIKGTPVFIADGGVRQDESGVTVNYMIVLSLASNGLHYSWFNERGEVFICDNQLLLPYGNQYLTEPVRNVTYFAEVLHVENGQGTWEFRMIADGRVYRIPKLQIGTDGFSALDTGVLEENLFSSPENPALIYTEIGKLYVDGTELALPDGKTVDQITQAVGTSSGLILFEDGSVYRYNKSGLTLEPELTALNQEGKIKSVFCAYTDSRDILLVLDDNLTYVLQ